jgi:hypothetical protein
MYNLKLIILIIVLSIFTRFSLTTNPHSIIIGDSQTPYIAKQSSKVKMLGKNPQQSSLWKGGINLEWLKLAVSKYSPNKDIKNVVINIGTNGRFNLNEDIPGLIEVIKKRFPNAKLFVVKGSWGWGVNKSVTEQKVNLYYNKFKELGVEVVDPAIGKVNDPHGDLPIYKVIAHNLDRVIN